MNPSYTIVTVMNQSKSFITKPGTKKVKKGILNQQCCHGTRTRTWTGLSVSIVRDFLCPGLFVRINAGHITC